MINNPVSLSRINQNLLFAVLIAVILYFARAFLIPVTFAILFAMLMTPLCNVLEKKGVNRILSVTLCVLILLLVLLTIASIIAIQFATFIEDFPQIKEKAERLFSSAKDFIFQKFNIPGEKQEQFIKERSESMGQSFGKVLTSILNGVASIPASVVLILLYTFLLLFHRERYESFFIKIFKDEERGFIKALLEKIMTVSQKYLKGRTISILILSVLYSVGLLIIGIKYAILLGCIAALLTVIPYVGTLIGGLFPFLMAIVNEDSWTPALWVAGLMIFIQALDNYFIEPYIIGGEVNLSALATILCIIAGGFIWGVAGMFLFIPMLGIAKIIFDNVEKLRPLGFLISDPDKPSRPIRKSPIKR
jgi:predicted PurR-regulated permease PerM